MAIDLVPLMTPGMVAGIALYLTEYDHVQSLCADVKSGHFRGMGVLVNLSEDVVDQAALWALNHALAFARCTVFGAMEWPRRLAERVSAHRPQFATAVVFVSTGMTLVTETVQTTINVLREQLGSALAVTVVVSDASESLASLDGVSGFVRGVRKTDGNTARMVFLTLSALSAPETLNGIDVLDLLPVLGTSTSPAAIAEGLWLRDGAGRMVYPTEADGHAVSGATRVLAVPFVRGWSWNELRRFSQALRKDVGNSAVRIIYATNNALTPGILPASVGWSPVLCLYEKM